MLSMILCCVSAKVKDLYAEEADNFSSTSYNSFTHTQIEQKLCNQDAFMHEFLSTHRPRPIVLIRRNISDFVAKHSLTSN